MTQVEQWARIGFGCAEHLIAGLFDGLGRLIEHIMEFFSRIAVPAADALVAFIAARAVMNLLDMPFWMALVAGIALEGVGQLVAEVPFAQRYYNQTLGEHETPVMEWAGWTVFGFHTVFSVGLIAVNIIRPDWALFGVAAMAVLSLTGTIAAVLRNDCRQRSGARSHSAVALPSPERVAEVIADMAPATAKDRVMWAYRENPHADKREVAQALGIGYSTVSKAYRELLAEGAIEHNGNGRH